MRHRGITDPTALQWWRDYQSVVREGNPLGVSFVEYIAARVNAQEARFVASTSTSSVHWYVSACGHQHPWGAPCSEMAVTQ